ncbi:MAG: hypothetical protein HC780_02655 [Leptolyngbyaceae cyanobacterium CSU_1_3]|nr:hypothetical protein [Leptolyngbyaceae cyanobacterium CSU_1_3]
MSRSSNSRSVVYLVVLSLTMIVWLLRGIGLLAFVPGFILWILIGLTIGLTIVNIWLETR